MAKQISFCFTPLAFPKKVKNSYPYQRPLKTSLPNKHPSPTWQSLLLLRLAKQTSLHAPSPPSSSSSLSSPPLPSTSRYSDLEIRRYPSHTSRSRPSPSPTAPSASPTRNYPSLETLTAPRSLITTTESSSSTTVTGSGSFLYRLVRSNRVERSEWQLVSPWSRFL